MAGKVLHLIDSGGLYGAERMLLTLVAEQKRQGWEPMILSAGELHIDEKPIEREARRLQLPVQRWRMKPGFNLRDSLAIIRWARSEGYDLLHSHGYKFNVLMGLWPRGVRRLPMVTTLHGYIKAPLFTRSWLYEALDRLFLDRMSCIVLVAEAMVRQIPAFLQRSEKLAIIPNGLDLSNLMAMSGQPLEPAISTKVADSAPLILGIGRLSREKGFDLLIPAFAQLRNAMPRARLIIVGEGKERAALEALVSEYKLTDAVDLPGYFQNVPALMARADLLCMPSRTEGLPITLLEAMAIGLPVMVTDVGEMATVLGQGQGGDILRETGPDALAAAMEGYLQDPERRAANVAWSRERVRTDYSGEVMAQHYIAAYEQVVR